MPQPLGLVLPYVEQDNLFKTMDPAKPLGDPVNVPGTQFPVNLYRCPSDKDNPVPTIGGATNYHANNGIFEAHQWMEAC